MSFLCRIGKSKLKQFSHQFKTIPHNSLLDATLSQNPCFVIHSKPNDFSYNVRFFAAPLQFQKKNKENKETNGPRLNEKITAEFVRLVVDDVHAIVSRREALARARHLNLDLVEVSGKANPPVCKIMDFNKEMYHKEMREKERAKAKAESALRQGNPKEVRFSGKTEQKDLQMKADNVMRLMEDGYKVKCTAKGTADQDVLGTLSRLCALIQDVAVVESGPTLGKDSAFLIVRHIKFGTLKKGGGKMKDLADASSGVLKAISTMASAAEPGLETDEETSFNDVDQANSSMLASSDSDIHDSDKMETSDGTENRYIRDGARNKFSSGNGTDQKNLGKRDLTRWESQFSNQGRKPPRDTQFSQRTGESDGAAISSPAFRNYRPPLNDAPSREPFNPGAPNTPRPGYGNFSGSTADSPRREPFSPGAPSTPRPRYGDFSGSAADAPRQEPYRPGTPNTPRAGYGNFGGSTANAPGKHGVEAGVGENKEQNRYAARRPATIGGLAPNQNLPNSKYDRSQPPNDTSRQAGFGIFSRD